MGTCNVKVDSVRNRVYVTLIGFSNEDEMAEHAKRVVNSLGRLKAGFVMISDISEIKATTPAGAKVLEAVLEEYKQHGIARIIRIVGQNMIGKFQFQRVTREADIPVTYVATLAEAELEASTAH